VEVKGKTNDLNHLKIKAKSFKIMLNHVKKMSFDDLR
jgi:hypothetical protein